MRTTLNIDDELLVRAKERAARRGVTLTALIEESMRRFLAPRRRGERFRLELLTKRGRTLPGVSLDDRDSLYELMEGRA